MEKQNILIISKYASSKEVGWETRLFALARCFVASGHSITIVSSDSNHFGRFPNFTKRYNYQVIEGIKVIWIKTLKYSKTISIKRVLSWLDFEWKLFFFNWKKVDKPDVIIVSSLSLLTILNGLYLKHKFKTKLIFEIRDIWPLTLVEEGGYSKYNPVVVFLSLVEKLGYRKSDLVVGTMPNIGQHVFNVTQNKNINCACLPFGFDLKQYDLLDRNEDILRKFDIPINKFIIGYAGSIGLSNGLGTLINVIKALNDDEQIFFLLIGDGGLKEKYENDLINCKNVIFTGNVERKHVSIFLSKCNALYFASLKSKVWDFGWSPNKLIDYMISGKPVIASYSGYQSMINEAESGEFVPAEDENALLNIFRKYAAMNHSELEIIGERGKKWLIENRQWNTLAQEYLNTINKLFSK